MTDKCHCPIKHAASFKKESKELTIYGQLWHVTINTRPSGEVTLTCDLKGFHDKVFKNEALALQSFHDAIENLFTI